MADSGLWRPVRPEWWQAGNLALAMAASAGAAFVIPFRGPRERGAAVVAPGPHRRRLRQGRQRRREHRDGQRQGVKVRHQGGAGSARSPNFDL